MEFELPSSQGRLEWLLSILTGAAPWWVWAIITGLFVCWLTAKPIRHAWRIRKANWVLRRLREIAEESGPAAQFGFLRSDVVDPFTFEEAILTALQRRKMKIRRNRRYTGDGGIDGMAWWRGKLILIQAKLYSSHINPKHVEEFAAICKRRRAIGLFVHSGKTGPLSKSFRDEALDIVSGDRLLQLLVGSEMILFPGGLKITLR